jgi:general secretion pathway protein A
MADTATGPRGPATPTAGVGDWKPAEVLAEVRSVWPVKCDKANGLKSFRLTSNPFSRSSVGGCVPLHPGTRRAIAQLTKGIEGRKGLLVLTGEIGTGKTTVLNQLRAWLAEKSIPSAYLFNPLLDARNFVEFVLAEFGIKAAPGTAGNAFAQLVNWLFARHREGATVVLIVDEAQCLAPSALQALDPLTNLESSGEKLLQVVLAGQPELNDLLRRPEFRPLRQQVSWHSRTWPLSLEGTHAYVDTRLQAAGSSSNAVFSAAALDAVHFYSGGIPRVINLLCEHALDNACTGQLEHVSAEMVDEVAREFEFDHARPVAPLNGDSIERTLRAMCGRSIESAPASDASHAAAARAEACTSEASENEKPAACEPVTALRPSTPADPRPVLQVLPSSAPARSVSSPASSVLSSQPERIPASVPRLLSATVRQSVSAFIARLFRGLLRSPLSDPRLRRYDGLLRDWKRSWASAVRWLNAPMRIARHPRSS